MNSTEKRRAEQYVQAWGEAEKAKHPDDKPMYYSQQLTGIEAKMARLVIKNAAELERRGIEQLNGTYLSGFRSACDTDEAPTGRKKNERWLQDNQPNIDARAEIQQTVDELVLKIWAGDVGWSDLRLYMGLDPKKAEQASTS